MTFIKKIRLLHFRNFERVDFSFKPGINQIVGENGVGKSNLLEALCLFSIGRSFRTLNLSQLIQNEKKSFHIDIAFEKDGIDQQLSLSFKDGKRVMRHNSTEFKGFSHLLGILPSVIYSPYDLKLIEDSPKFRRQFLNIHIAQSDPLYIRHLSRYSKVLLQRNALLKAKTLNAIEIWEGELAKSSSYLMNKRRQAVNDLSQLMQKEYQFLSQKNENPSISYNPSLTNTPEPYLWANSREKELQYGYTLIGPHRDNFKIQLSNQEAKSFASEGQKRTLIAALKLSENKRLDNPFLAIDDFSAHLDQNRRSLLMKQVSHHKQIFLTTPEKLPISSHIIHLS